jgi:hypothetical protein
MSLLLLIGARRGAELSILCTLFSFVLLAHVQAKIYDGSANLDDQKLFDNANRIRDMGRLLMATEIRSMLTYWHVQAPGTPGVSRVYPGKISSFNRIFLRTASGHRFVSTRWACGDCLLLLLLCS